MGRISTPERRRYERDGHLLFKQPVFNAESFARLCAIFENVFNTEIAGIDESTAVTFELEPNQCSLHDSRIVHGAPPNKSPRRRCGYTMRYFSQHMKLNPDHPSNREFRIWHCRGNNPHSNPVE